MARDNHKLWESFGIRLRQMMLQYGELEKENSLLRDALEKEKERCRVLAGEAEGLKRQCTNLKTTRMLTISNDDVKETKAQIARLMREVDKCIALLKAQSADGSAPQ